MRWLRTALAIFVAAASIVPRAARAESSPLPLELDWEAPEGCPDTAFVVHRVEQILRGMPAPRGRMDAKGAIRKTGADHFELTLTMRIGDVDDAREIEATSCSALAEATAALIALAIDPGKTPPPPPAETPPPVTPRLEASPPRRRPVTDAPRRAAPTPTRVAIGLGTAIEHGTLPHLGAGLFASGAIDLRRFRFGVRGAFSFRQRPVFEPVAGAGASFDALAVGAFGAYMVPLGAFALGPAANLEATYMRVEGFGIRDPRASWFVWPTVVLGARGELDLVHRLRAVARADLLVPFGAPTIILGDPGSNEHLYEVTVPAVRFSLGAEIVLP